MAPGIAVRTLADDALDGAQVVILTYQFGELIDAFLARQAHPETCRRKVGAHRHACVFSSRELVPSGKLAGRGWGTTAASEPQHDGNFTPNRRHRFAYLVVADKSTPQGCPRLIGDATGLKLVWPEAGRKVRSSIDLCGPGSIPGCWVCWRSLLSRLSEVHMGKGSTRSAIATTARD